MFNVVMTAEAVTICQQMQSNYHSPGNNSNDFGPLFFCFNSSNSNRILSSRELIILSDSNFWCVWGSCAVCCGQFSHEDRHAHSRDTAQHRDAQHSHMYFFNVAVFMTIHCNNVKEYFS